MKSESRNKINNQLGIDWCWVILVSTISHRNVSPHLSREMSIFAICKYFTEL